MAEKIEKALPRVAKAHGLNEYRLRTWVSFIAFCGLLERATQEGVLPNGYEIKGGAALELRFGLAARSTKDLDLGLQGDRKSRFETFEKALALGFDDFRFRRKAEPRDLDRAHTYRFEVAVSYKNKGFQTIEIDLGPGGHDVDFVALDLAPIAELGVPVASPVRCLTMPQQIAQKIHAGTNPQILADPRQNRGRDIVDVLLLELLEVIDYAAVHEAAVDVFAARAQHEWPPRVPEYPAAWIDTMIAVAGDVEYPELVSGELLNRFGTVLQKVIDAVPNSAAL